MITKGTTPTTNGHAFTDSGINFVKIESISSGGEFLTEKFAHISDECHKELRRSQLHHGDVLFSIAGALGRVAVVSSDILPANTNQALAIVRPKKSILSKYLAFFLGSANILDEIQKLKVGVAQYNISLKQVGELEIPLPSLEIQNQMVEEMEKEEEIITANRRLVELMNGKIVNILCEL